MAIGTWQQHKKILMKDPEFKKEFEALEPEYALKSRLIELRMKKELTQKELAESPFRQRDRHRPAQRSDCACSTLQRHGGDSDQQKGHRPVFWQADFADDCQTAS